MPREGCEDGIVVMHNVAYRERSTYSSTVDVFGGVGSGNYSYERSTKVKLFCEPYDEESYPEHVVQCSVEGYEQWQGASSYTNTEPYSWNDYKVNYVEAFLVTDIPRATMDLGGGNVATRLGHSGNISPYHFIVLHGDINAIKSWVEAGSKTWTTTLVSTNVYYATTTNITTHFEGWEIDCVIHDKTRQKYPYCGGTVRGQEDKGRQFLNLCSNPWGDCDEDCCDCCSAADLFLQTINDGDFYLVGG